MIKQDEGVDQNLKIIFQSIELKLYKNYFLNDKKISQQQVLDNIPITFQN